jgi:CBS domain-containing protein
MMMLKDVMTRDPVVIAPDAMLQEAAQVMRDIDSGVIPVCDGKRLLGMLTDRDIAVRAAADGKDPKATPVHEVMTSDIAYCFEDDDVQKAASAMEERQIRRLIVLDRDKGLAGIVSLGDLAVHTADDRLAGEVAEAVSEPADPER